MRKYLLRSVKYLIALCVLYVALVALMGATGTLYNPAPSLFETLFRTPRGWTMVAAIVLLAIFYPRFGFVRRCIEGQLDLHRRQVETAFANAGFTLRREEEGTLVFVADNPLRRLALLFEDEIRVGQYGQWIEIEGNRRAVARIVYRLEAYIENSHE